MAVYEKKIVIIEIMIIIIMIIIITMIIKIREYT